MFSRRASAVMTLVLVALVAFALVVSAALPGLAATAGVAAAAARAATAARAAVPQHARLVGATPADGSTVRTAAEVVLAFSEDVDARFLRLQVQGPAGDEAGGDPVVAGRSVIQPLVGGLPAGEHTVTYRVVSVDGHPISGSVRFTTTAAPATSSPAPSAPQASGTPGPTPQATGTAGAPADPVGSVAPATPAAPAAPAAPASVGETPGWVLPTMILGLLALLGGAGALAGRGRRRRADGPDRTPA